MAINRNIVGIKVDDAADNGKVPKFNSTTKVFDMTAAPQFTTIELGHATDTTLSRVSAGVIAVEGVNVALVNVATLDSLTSADSLSWTGMNQGTDGEIPTFDASGEPAFVAAGTSGQVLTSNGAGAAPTFQAAAGGGGDNVVFVAAGDFVPGANCTLGEGGTAWIGTANFADAAQGRALVNVKVPAGCSGITSIEVIYQNAVASTLQLYLEYETASLNLDSLPSAVNSDTNGGVAQYASDSTNGNIAKVTVPAAAYNALTNVDADDIITMRINREGANANDTYDTTWSVIGVVFTFTTV